MPGLPQDPVSCSTVVPEANFERTKTRLVDTVVYDCRRHHGPQPQSGNLQGSRRWLLVRRPKRIHLEIDKRLQFVRVVAALVASRVRRRIEEGWQGYTIPDRSSFCVVPGRLLDAWQPGGVGGL